MVESLKPREANIQKKMHELRNPDSTPKDMLSTWDTNGIQNQDTAQFQHAIEYTTSGWTPRYKNILLWQGSRVNDHMHNIDAKAKNLAIEASKSIIPQGPQEEKKKGIMGLFGGK